MLAAAALVVCLWVPIRAAGLTAEQITATLPSIKLWLILATLLYLVAGTVFYIARYGDD